MKNAILIILLLVVFPLTPFVVMGCVARSQVVDDLSKSHAETAAQTANNAEALARTTEIVANNTALIAKANETLSNLAKVQANIAKELGSSQSPVADKIATIAEMQVEIVKVHEHKANANNGQAQTLAIKAGQHAANALDLSDVPSGPQVNIGKMVTDAATGNWPEVILGILLLGAGTYAKKKSSESTRNLKLAEEVAEMEPTKAREHLKAKKV